VPDNDTSFDKAIKATIKKGHKSAEDIAKAMKADLGEVERRIKRLRWLNEIGESSTGRLYVQEKIS
jgi:hypothetical protein